MNAGVEDAILLFAIIRVLWGGERRCIPNQQAFSAEFVVQFSGSSRGAGLASPPAKPPGWLGCKIKGRKSLKQTPACPQNRLLCKFPKRKACVGKGEVGHAQLCPEKGYFGRSCCRREERGRLRSLSTPKQKEDKEGNFAHTKTEEKKKGEGVKESAERSGRAPMCLAFQAMHLHVSEAAEKLEEAQADITLRVVVIARKETAEGDAVGSCVLGSPGTERLRNEELSLRRKNYGKSGV
ncbi:uncharacterized protein LOC115948016 [Geospiza fortis]|uniref:Uncharacterized protein LOC115948016 n=1 Tax=Geospiza fortis TaxID=48883 RepID=A0A8N5EQK5_GEOFO|nr:uncharacterized protein LOC115948016 [Geospiza fortis]